MTEHHDGHTTPAHVFLTRYNLPSVGVESLIRSCFVHLRLPLV